MSVQILIQLHIALPFIRPWLPVIWAICEDSMFCVSTNGLVLVKYSSWACDYVHLMNSNFSWQIWQIMAIIDSQEATFTYTDLRRYIVIPILYVCEYIRTVSPQASGLER